MVFRLSWSAAAREKVGGAAGRRVSCGAGETVVVTLRQPCESGRNTLKENLWNFDDFLCLSRPGVEASQNIVFIIVFRIRLD